VDEGEEGEEGEQPALTVALAGEAGAAPLFTRGTVTLEAAVGGGTPDAVRLREGDRLLATLSAPPFRFAWSTAGEPEGLHRVTAEATAGGRTFTSAPLEVHVDRTPPTVTGRTPAPGSADVAVGAEVSVTFSEPLLAGTVTADAARLSGGGAAWTPALSPDGTRLTWTPSARPAAPASVTASLGPALTDRAGNPLAPAAWGFDYPHWLALGGPLSGSPGATGARGVRLAASATGALYAAWVEPGADGADAAFVARWADGQWQVLGGALGGEPGATPVKEVALAVDAAGAPVVAWTEEATRFRTRLYARAWDGASWAGRGDFLGRHIYTLSTTLPRLQAAGGLLHLAWVDMHCGPQEVDACFSSLAATRWDGAAWSPVAAHDLASPATSLGFAVDTLGRLVTATHAWTSDGRRDWLAAQLQRYAPAPAPGWSALGPPVDAADRDVGVLQLALDAVDRPVLAWREETDAGFRLYAGSMPGNTFVPYAGPVNWNGDVADALSLALAPTGEPVVAFSGLIQGQRRVGLSRWSGTAWAQLGPALDAVALPGTGATGPCLLDAAGRLVVAWTESDGTAANVHVVAFNDR
jgi:hypothetical protein